jgi:hypothetical protein
MRPEPNNEIDLLLRQLSRQNGIPVSETDEQHLDADELNSYVANALPAKTRARYTLHLADCSSCRKIVAQLSAAEGVVAVRQPAAVVEPSGLKSFLASFFSPLVLRYAVPALGVIALTVAVFVMWRQEQRTREGASVAQVTKTDENKSAPENPSAATTPTATPVPELSKQSPRAGVITEAPAPVVADAPPPPKAAPAEEAERQPEAKKAGNVAEPDAAVADANQPVDTGKADKTEKADRADQSPKKDKQQEAIAAAPATVMTPGNAAPEPQRAKTAKTTVTAGAGSADSDTKSQAYERSRREESRGTFLFAETRSVAGRNFRKEGNAWIDVAYSSYRATTIVITRGTEQYRALIANEPEIHTIAENLKSEFVVVWKGRAYRIR